MREIKYFLFLIDNGIDTGIDIDIGIDIVIVIVIVIHKTKLFILLTALS